MSTQEGTFNLPFISNWIRERPVHAQAHCMKRNASEKEMAICLDDDPLSLRLVEHLLKGRYDVISCANIDAAVQE